MDKDRKEASAKEARASMKEAIGIVTGNSRAQVEGAVEKESARNEKKHEDRPKSDAARH